MRIGQAVGFHAGVVSAVQLAVDYAANPEAGSEGVANQVFEALGTAGGGQFLVHLGEGAAQGFTEGEEVSVVVDEHRNAENFLQVRPQGHAVAERREVGQEAADNAGGVIGRAGEGKADGLRLYVSQLIDDVLEAGHHGFQAQVQVVGIGRKGERVQNELFSPHGVEAQRIAACIQGEHHPLVVLILSHISVLCYCSIFKYSHFFRKFLNGLVRSKQHRQWPLPPVWRKGRRRHPGWRQPCLYRGRRRWNKRYHRQRW